MNFTCSQSVELFKLCCIEIIVQIYVDANSVFKVIITFFTFIKVLHFLSIHGIIGVDLCDIGGQNTKMQASGDFRHFCTALRLATSTRGIRTKFEIKGIPSSSNKFISTGTHHRTRFLIRQIAIVAWQYLAIDLLYFGLAQHMQATRLHLYNPGSEFLSAWTTVDEMVARVVLLIIGVPACLILLDVIYRVFSVIFVATCMTRWEDWPPVFGSVCNAYTVRSFWGQVLFFLNLPIPQLVFYFSEKIPALANFGIK
jgi:hypothetical protein